MSSQTTTVQMVGDASTTVPLTDTATQVVTAADVGPRGPAGTGAIGSASGTVASSLLVWTMPHNLGFAPAGWIFRDLAGAEMEPESITDITTSVATATWRTPVSGSWSAS